MKMLFGVLCALISFQIDNSASEISRHAFDDTIMYNINWPGKNGYHLLEELEESRSMVVTSHEKETYKCILPVIKETKEAADEEYNGPNPIDLLAPIFIQSPCTTLLESYWTYELCHGKYIRQYHEEREGKKVKIQEYYLGRWDKAMTAKLSVEFDKEYVYKEKEEGKQFNPPLKKLDGITLPYLQFNFTDGTICDINGKPRRTNVLYVCFSSGKNDIFTVKETSSCEYEAIVVSPELCKHPKYRPQVNVEHEINCLPVGEAPTKPRSLVEMEEEIFKQSHFPAFDDSKNGHMFAVHSIDEFRDKDGRMQVRVELRPLDNDVQVPDLPSGLDSGDTPPTDESNDLKEDMPSNVPLATAESSVDSSEEDLLLFLTGKYCINGGFGWWKYYFCYGKPISQYHYSKKEGGGREKVSITLGVWNEAEHIKWLEKKPHKRPKPLETRTYITHFYGNGDICGETGKPRETEVRLQCAPKDKNSQSPFNRIYHLEPQVCQYILIFESHIICDLLPLVDENGLVDVGLLLK